MLIMDRRFEDTMAGMQIGGPSGQPRLRERRSQRFTVNTQAATMDGRSLSNESSSSNAYPEHPDAQYQQHYSTTGPYTPPLSGGYAAAAAPGTRTSGSGAATWARAGLPPGWLTGEINGQTSQQPSQQPSQPQPPNSASLPGQDYDDDELIPTALVLKNIAFSIRPEVIPTLMKDLNLPLPTAFNYHYDDGTFRGLAFANFRYGSEADAALAALNGYELQGRRLRVEYKRMLRAGEKERIERDKAIKRMRSAASVGGTSSGSGPPMARREPSQNGFDEDDYGARTTGQNYAPPVPQIPQMHANTAFALAQIGSPPSDSGMSGSSQSNPSGGGHERPKSFAASPAPSPAPAKLHELDMNDPQTLEIYSRVLLFKDDALRDELAFSRSLSPIQRRIVHLVAQKLQLEHGSTGEGENRQVVVYKPGCAPAKVVPPLRHAASSIYDMTTPSSPLRSKKSMGDIRSSGQYAPAVGPPLPQRKSVTDLRGGFAAAASPTRRPELFAPSTTPVPAMPSYAAHQFGVIGPPSNTASPVDPPPAGMWLPVSSFAEPSQSVPLRQPRGPDDAGRGFARPTS